MANLPKYPDPAALRQRLHYAPYDEPENGLRAGEWRWRQDIHHPNGHLLVHAGDRAGHVKKNGTVVICFKQRLYPAHRLAFVYMTGNCPIGNVQHIDGDKGNNAWSNLLDRSAPRIAPPNPPVALSRTPAHVTIITETTPTKTTVTIRCRDGSALVIRSGLGLQVLRVYHLPTESEAADLFSRMASTTACNSNDTSFTLNRRGSRVGICRKKDFPDERTVREAFLAEASKIYDELDRAA